MLGKICVICGSTNNLNTTLGVKIDNQDVKLYLCDEHADDTTKKQAIDAYIEKTKDLRTAINILEEAGYTIVPPGQQIKSVQKSKEINKKPKEDASNTISADDSQLENQRVENALKNVNAAQGGGIMPAYDVKRDGKAKIIAETIQTSKGSVNIPKKIQDASGTTNIRVIKTDNNTLKKRLDILTSSNEGVQTTLKECPACGGTGINKVNGKECPKCNGSGMIEVYI